MPTPPDLGFINAPHDRADQFRSDQSWVEAKLEDANTKIVLFVGDRPAVDVSGKQPCLDYRSAITCGQETSWQNPVLLNLDDQERATFAVQLPPEAENSIASNEIKLIDLRSLAMQACLPDGQLGMLAQARSILQWHAFHKFCANCGVKTARKDAGYRRKCPSCERDHFPRVDPVVIMLVRHENKFLMGRGANFPQGSFSALAGFVEPGETLEDATRRETFEETGVEIGEVQYMMSQPWPFPSTLMIGMLARAVSTKIVLDTQELEEARWFGFDEIDQMMNHTHPKELSLPSTMSIAYQMMKQMMLKQIRPAS